MFEIKVLVEDMRNFLQSQNKKGESIQNLEAIKEKKVTNAVTKKKKMLHEKKRHYNTFKRQMDWEIYLQHI